MPRVKKADLLARIIQALQDNLAVLVKAAQTSHAEATHESSKAENKYDTRGLEAAYLAGGQARQAKEILESIKIYQGLNLKDFGPVDPIDLSALVELQTDRATGLYFIGPRSGGLEITHPAAEITVITPQSPLGQQLIGKKAGDHWTANLATTRQNHRILSVT